MTATFLVLHRVSATASANAAVAITTDTTTTTINNTAATRCRIFASSARNQLFTLFLKAAPANPVFLHFK